MHDAELLKRMMVTMYRIRLFEERLKNFYDYQGYYRQDAEAQDVDDLLTCLMYDFESDGMIGGAVHLYIGMEAVATGVCADLTDQDTVFSTHRGHGHAIAKGADLKETLAELMGREDGQCKGFGGSMHIFDPKIGLMGGNGIVGAGMPIALGPAFAAKYRDEPHVSVAFLGDGASNQGTFHESLNLAALWELPVIFVCENNLYAASTPFGIAFPTHDVAPRALGYGVPGMVVDGQDVVAVHAAASDAIGRAREGGGPTLIEAKTFRFESHCAAGMEHQDLELLEEWKKRDPIRIHEERLMADGLLTSADLEELKTQVTAEIDEAQEFAKASPLAGVELLEAFEE